MALRFVAFAALLLAAALAGCTTPPPIDGNGGAPDADPVAIARTFDEENAFDWIVRQVQAQDGTPQYRIPGTEANTRVARMLADEFAQLGWDTSFQNFTGPIDGVETAMHNVVATLPGATAKTLILGAHYDSRPWADKDPDPAKREEPVLGANDAGSGVGVWMEYARILAARENNLTFRIVFFDGEDAGQGGDGWILGSTHYAESMSADEVRDTRAMILLDIVGDVDLELRREGYSSQAPHKALQDRIWQAGASLNFTQFVDTVRTGVIDDHRPFQQRGIVAVDVIHLDSGADPFPDSHHTTFDDLGHVSKASLRAVGVTVLAVVVAMDQEAVRDASF